MLSQTAEYALRAVVCLANIQEPLTTKQIATYTKVPESYLSKVMQALVKATVVVSRRGVGGGFQLRRAPHTIPLLEVINAVDPMHRITSCPLGLKAHGRALCPLHRQLDLAIAMLQESFAGQTIASIMNPQAKSFPLGFCPKNNNQEPLQAKG